MLSSIKIEKSLLLSLLSFSLIIILRDLFDLSIPQTVISLVAVLGMLILSYNHLFSFLFFLFPFTCGIPGYTILIAFVILIIKKGSITYKQLIPVLIILLLELINQASIISTEYSSFFSFISFCAIFFFILNDEEKVNHYNNLLFFVVGSCIVFLIIYYNILIQSSFDDFISSSTYRVGVLEWYDAEDLSEVNKLIMNANELAYYAICSISILLFLIPLSKNKVLLTFLLLFCFLSGVLTYSRTFILCTVLIILFCIVFLRSQFSLKGLLICSVIIFIGYYYFGTYSEDIFSTFEDRLNEDNVETAGSRTTIFISYNEKWAESGFYVLFGCGVIDYAKTLGLLKSMHNGIQQIYVCLGVLGFTLFIQQIVTFIRNHIKKPNILYITPFIITIIFDQSIQFLSPATLMFPIVTSLTVCKLPLKRNFFK